MKISIIINDKFKKISNEIVKTENIVKSTYEKFVIRMIAREKYVEALSEGLDSETAANNSCDYVVQYYADNIDSFATESKSAMIQFYSFVCLIVFLIIYIIANTIGMRYLGFVGFPFLFASVFLYIHYWQRVLLRIK